ncbi:co-chaperone DjlA [Paraferrimonas sp. SM1919]|uniref:co-chaperone DjlA n=1 Tax=Paraferrimonas sp. SM1919 TaxID=2662263 RepID=UPI0013D7740F|nr:co-chaperone DjlA [Paraferrimonas sp. SM1919]
MAIKGKLWGALIGFALGRIFGALIGLVIGHWYDLQRHQPALQKQNAFLYATFSVLGHIAKASGVVTRSDINLAVALMDKLELNTEARRSAQQAFTDGKAADFELAKVIKTLRNNTIGRRDVRQMFVEVQVQMALNDGKLDASEVTILYKIGQYLSFSQSEIDNLLEQTKAHYRSHQGGGSKMTQSDARKILGVSTDADAKTIKRAYRKAMAKHHPDKLVAKGLPQEAINLAKEKAQDIQLAYDCLK